VRKFRRKQLKQDKFVESMVAVPHFFSRHAKLLIFIGLVAVGVIAVMTSIGAYRRSMDSKASSLFQKAGGADAFLELYHNYPRSTVAPIALYEAAAMLFAGGSYGESKENFRLFLEGFPGHPLAPDALNSVGYCLEAEGQVLQAAGAYRNVAKEYPDAAAAPGALINSARCYRLAGKDGEAVAQYEMVIRDFPGSLRRVDAERYLAELESAPEKVDSDKAGG